MKNKKIYFENLDGLRFLCFLSVFLFHSFHTEYAYISDSGLYHFIKKDLFGNGSLGVNFFFVLSGYLITYLLIEEKKLNGQIDLKKFWIRRILRIWPLFYMCVLFGFYVFPLLKTAFGQTPNETASMAYYLTFTNNFDFIQKGLPDASVLGVLWSVAIEEQFYLIWPIILYVLPIKKYWMAFSAIIGVSLIFRGFNDSYIMHEYHTLSCIGDMAVGAFGAWLIIEKAKFKQKIVDLNKLTLVLIYTVFALIFFFRDEFLHTTFLIRVFERQFISIVILLIILEQCFTVNSLFKMSSFKRISKLGLITYGLYCLHFIGILIATTLTKKLAINTELWQVLIIDTLLALTITIIISKISYRFYEKPFLKFKEKFAFITK
ncbi:MAG: acyltransferase [Aureispira sp.]|nr:acyltransferase [Aureispira sp.]